MPRSQTMQMTLPNGSAEHMLGSMLYEFERRYPYSTIKITSKLNGYC